MLLPVLMWNLVPICRPESLQIPSSLLGDGGIPLLTNQKRLVSLLSFTFLCFTMFWFLSLTFSLLSFWSDVNFVFDWMTNAKDSQLKCTFWSSYIVSKLTNMHLLGIQKFSAPAFAFWHDKGYFNFELSGYLFT